MNSKLVCPEVDLLFKAISRLETTTEYYDFFEDLCTVAELKSLAQRIKVAQLLDEGKTYTEVFNLTGASTATISRINKCLEYGANGYRVILDKLKEDE